MERPLVAAAHVRHSNGCKVPKADDGTGLPSFLWTQQVAFGQRCVRRRMRGRRGAVHVANLFGRNGYSFIQVVDAFNSDVWPGSSC